VAGLGVDALLTLGQPLLPALHVQAQLAQLGLELAGLGVGCVAAGEGVGSRRLGLGRTAAASSFARARSSAASAVARAPQVGGVPLGPAAQLRGVPFGCSVRSPGSAPGVACTCSRSASAGRLTRAAMGGGELP
jgi:hypothetical protein